MVSKIQMGFKSADLNPVICFGQCLYHNASDSKTKIRPREHLVLFCDGML